MMSEEFWWSHCGLFYDAGQRSKFVRNIHAAFFRNVDSLNLPAGSKALDAGCGTGSSTFPLAKRGFDVLGVDFGMSVLNRAAWLNSTKYGFANVDFRLMDLSKRFPIEDESFDFVGSLHCIMKIDSVDVTLKEFHRILKPRGKMVISTTPDSYTITEWLRRYVREHGLARALWDIRWLVVWAIPYFIFTERSERRQEHRWGEEAFSKNLKLAGFKTLHMERVPYINVGCIIGVFEKEDGAVDPGLE
jgi:ubiquinone/menaquinone biosynthesis C-methylase UbiE